MTRNSAATTGAVARGKRVGIGVRASAMLLLLAAGELGLRPVFAVTPSTARDSAVQQTVFGIISYARWPTPRTDVRLCVAGKTRFILDMPEDPAPPSTPHIVTQPVRADDHTVGTRCDALYLGELPNDERQQLVADIASYPVLTISERDDSCTQGAMFCLNIGADRVTFDVNLDRVARSSVRVSPSVLKLARKPGGQ